jgi:hypothetical protein
MTAVLSSAFDENAWYGLTIGYEDVDAVHKHLAQYLFRDVK